MRRQIVDKQANSWQWFPLGMIGSLVIVAGVNGYMVYSAYHTFPGSAGEDGFDLSNNYGHVLDAASTQAQLGWHVAGTMDAARHPLVRALDRNGQTLQRAKVTVRAARPVGPPQTTELTLLPAVDGSLRATEVLDVGQWDLAIAIEQDGKVLSATQRLVVR
jgi:nitrogen fixation protein FixH